MGFKYDATGVSAGEGFPLIEKEGWYPFRIVATKEGQSKNGDYQVTVDCACLDPRYKNFSVRHWVTFMPPDAKGAGMAIHFLKCIGELFEGKLNVDPMSWECKVFMGYCVVNTYEKDGVKKRNNKLDKISPIPDEGLGDLEPSQKTAFEE